MSPFWFQSALLPDGWASDVRILIEEGLIQRVESGVPPAPDDERHPIALPGLANLHSHAFQRGMAGLAERRGPGADSFWTWRDTMYRFANAIEPEQMEAIAALAFVEMLERGFTGVAEFHYVHRAPDGSAYADPAEMGGRLAAAAADTGIALTLLPVLYQTAGFDRSPAGPEQRRFVQTLDQYAVLLEASRKAVAGSGGIVGIAPHSLRAVPPDALATIAQEAPDGAPIHIHIAEQTGEVEVCLAATGQRPVAWLLNNMPVNRRWCLVHATHVNAKELMGIAASGAVAGLCPVTEANLGDGIFPADRYRGAFGIGSDSNILIGAAAELCALEYSQRLATRTRNVLASDVTSSTGRRLFDQALGGGMRALGRGKAGLQAGARADFMTLDLDQPGLIGRSGDALLDAFIFANSHGMIDTVWSGGRRLVEGGRHIAREAIAGRYAKALLPLLAA